MSVAWDCVIGEDAVIAIIDPLGCRRPTGAAGPSEGAETAARHDNLTTPIAAG